VQQGNQIATSAAGTRAAARAPDIRDVIAAGAVRSVYQPIVHLATGATAGYEALARGPEGSTLERPDQLFAAATEAGLLAELDWECRKAAVRGALDARLDPSHSLFVNVEPSTIGAPIPESARELMAAAGERLSVVLEITERALTDRPAEMLRTVERLRKLGWGFALDDVGVDRRSLALMPFVEPEVIKLDLQLAQNTPSTASAAIMNAVNAEAERSGAAILSEGIETEEHLDIALAMGARYGQGWMFGRPGPLPDQLPAPGPRLGAPHRALTFDHAETPFAIISREREPRRGTKRLLLSISRHLEAQALDQGESAVVLATFQDAEFFTPASRWRYRKLAERMAFVSALGVGIAETPEPGVRGIALEAAERLRGEWNVTVIAPHFAAAFVARDLGDSDDDMSRRFEFVLTYDRDLAVRAATSMMARVAPAA
jgi:EAL domain-containing protein (putative c-di-GMP-specific phosphodiesterase class I)